MRNARSRLAVIGGALVALGALSACNTSTDGTPSVQAHSGPAASTAATSPSAPVTVTSSPPRTVTVTPTKRVVTRVAPAPDVPHSFAALSDLLDRATVVDNGDYTSSGGDGVFFDAPSQNIGCYLSDSGVVQCAIHDYDFPQDGPDCHSGIGATLDAGGNPSLTACSGYFPVAGRGGVLRYGTALEGDDLACVSEPGGVSCLNRDTRTGFTLSKQAFTPVY